MINELHQEDICKGSGVSLEIAEKAGIESYEEKTVEDGFDSKGRKQKKYYCGGWRIPITNPLNPEEIYYYRMKPDKPAIVNKGKQNEREIKYLTPKGQIPRLYFPKFLNWKEILESNKEIIITEGEKKSLCLVQNGYIAVAVSGVWCWQKDHLPIEDMELLLKKKRRVLICFDNDWKTKPQVQQALEAMYDYILSKGSSPVYACTPEGRHKGVDDYIVAKGIDSFNSYIDLVKEKHAEKSQLEHEIECAVNKEFKELVKATNKFLILIRDCHRLGVVGEETNIVLILLALATYKNETPISQVVKGETDSGKTFVFNTLLNLVPQDKIIKVASFSAQALAHVGDISNHIIVETEGNSTQDDNYKSAVMYLRQLITEKEITRMISEVDPHGKGDKKIIARLKKTKGPIQYNMLTTQERLNDENENRLMCLNICNDPEHREKIQERNSEKWAGKRIDEFEKKVIVEKWRKYINLLPSIKDSDILIPFAKFIKVVNYQGSNRDQDRMCLLTGLVHWFHMINEKTFDERTNTTNFDEYSSKYADADSIETSNEQIISTKENSPGAKKRVCVCATVQDYKMLYDLVISFYNSRSTDVTQGQLDIYHKIKNVHGETKFTSKKLAGTLKKGIRTVQSIIKGLCESGLIDKLDEKEGKFDVYKLNGEWEFRGCGLISPEELADKFNYTKEKSKDNTMTHTHTSLAPTENDFVEKIPQATAVIPKDSDSLGEYSSFCTQFVEDDEEIDEDDMFNFD